MNYPIPECLKAKVNSFVKEFEENISCILNSPIRINITIHNSHVTESEIRQMVIDVFGFEWEAIISPKRTSDLTAARMSYCYLCKMYLDKITLAGIGRRINRDHTTVINALETIEAYLETKDEKVYTKLTSIINKLNVYNEPKKI